MWELTRENWNFAFRNAKQRTRCIASGSLLSPLLIMATTAALSQYDITHFPFHSFPQTAAANMIGMSSLTVMCNSRVTSGHLSWNHSLSENAPQPHLPDASDVTATYQLLHLASYMNDTPFHCSAKRSHHSISDLASLLSRTKWSRCLTTFPRSNSLRMKDRPGLTTLHAWDSTPMRDSRSLFLQHFLARHCFKVSLSLASFSRGNLSCMATVSTSIPRNTSVVHGLSFFLGQIGVPVASHIFSITPRFSWHSSDPGLPTVIKSSR